MCGAFAVGVWWLFPLVGFLLCFVFMIVGCRFACMGRGGMCTGWGRTDEGHDRAGQGAPGRTVPEDQRMP